MKSKNRSRRQKLNDQQARIEQIRNGQQFLPGLEECAPDYLRPFIKKSAPPPPVKSKGPDETN